ncbi:MAG TPA: SDR family oxidoreductase [Armatimonadota bacterium]|nr:SDR family oxidoreductase [Armatimonadota bacterium]HPP74686.1 SDR family oxidoreductase [Armatimonadota bacterium]
MKTLRDKTVVITGASSGIGRAAAVAFAKRGSNLVLAARRTELLEKVKAEVEGLGVKALTVPTDVTAPRQSQGLIDASIEHFGQIDVLVNNAGRGILGAFPELTIEDVKSLFDVNFFGAVKVMQSTLEAMERQGWGVIINVASVAGLVSAPYTSAYNATKAALIALSESASAEYFGTRIEIVAFCPASTVSEFDQSMQKVGRFQKWIHPLKKASPEWVAERLVRAALKPKPLILLGTYSRTGVIAKFLTPSLYYRAIRWYRDVMQEANPPLDE